VRVLGYPIETVLAEKLATAIMLGAANTRVRDYADIYTLTGRHDLIHGAVRAALDATARFRGVEIVPLSSVLDDLVELRQRTYRAYRAYRAYRTASAWTAPSLRQTSARSSRRSGRSRIRSHASPAMRAGIRQTAGGLRRRSQQRSHSRSPRRRGTASDGAGRMRIHWTDDVLPARFRRRVAVGYDRTRVAFAGRRWTAQTVRRVHGMEEVRGSIPLSSTSHFRRSAACSTG
jgi:hypothetical protein